MAEYIDKEAAIAIIEERQKQLCPVGMFSRRAVYGTDREKFDAWQEILDEIDYLPAADMRENVKARWEWIEAGDESCYYCTNCGEHNFYQARFCPDCGAQMGGAEDG